MPMRSAFLLVACAVFTACTSAGDAPADALETVTEATPTETVVPNDGLPAALTGLNLQTNHATGSVLRVTGVRFGADHIAVDLEFTNGLDYEQKLNQYRRNNLVVRDNLGNVYNLSAPPNNGDVAVPAGQSIAGEFVFLGRINPAATALTLVTNEDSGGDGETSRDPKMTIQIPMSS